MIEYFNFLENRSLKPRERSLPIWVLLINSALSAGCGGTDSQDLSSAVPSHVNPSAEVQIKKRTDQKSRHEKKNRQENEKALAVLNRSVKITLTAPANGEKMRMADAVKCVGKLEFLDDRYRLFGKQVSVERCFIPSTGKYAGKHLVIESAMIPLTDVSDNVHAFETTFRRSGDFASTKGTFAIRAIGATVVPKNFGATPSSELPSSELPSTEVRFEVIP